MLSAVTLTGKNARIADLIELRKLRRAREGIDVAKLNKGDAKRRKKRAREGDEQEEEEGMKAGLRKGASLDEDEYVYLPFCVCAENLC